MKFSITLALIALMLYFSSVATGYNVIQNIYYNSTNCDASTMKQPLGFYIKSKTTCSTGCYQGYDYSASEACFESIANLTTANDTIFTFGYSDDTCGEGNLVSGFSMPIDTCVSSDYIRTVTKDLASSVKTSGCDTLYYYSDLACTKVVSEVKISASCVRGSVGSTNMLCNTLKKSPQNSLINPQNSVRNTEKSAISNALALTVNSILLITLLIISFIF